MEDFDKKKSHRKRNSGRKSEKKKSKDEAKNPVLQLTDKQRNPKAFAFNSAVRAERKFRRKQDIETKKQHIPLVDRTPLEPPPIVIAVVGPPKVGKTTLINSLLKMFIKSPLSCIKGPVTIVTGKKRRITLIECNNDINSMIDLAKVADLVLLLCDASFGFEMEVFEFLNICQVHGMPRIMGVLTHLDMIKNSKALKTTKKTLKHRFWTEICQGAKLFYLSGILHEEYLRNEVKNLGRFISIMKFRPLTWRTTHSYLLGDRYEDLTSLEEVRKNPKCDRNISIYGYVRGIPLNKDSYVHIAGYGDLKISNVSHLPDPCPLPEALKKRALIEKEKLIYAPFSGVGGIVYDKDAVYVELGGSHSHNVREDDETNNLVTNLVEAKETLDMKMQHSELQLFTGGLAMTEDDFDNGGENRKSPGAPNLSDQSDEDGNSEEDHDSEGYESEIDDSGDDLKEQHAIDFDEDQSDEDQSEEDQNDEDQNDEQSDEDENDEDQSDEDQDDEDNKLKWKENLVEKAKDAFLERLSNTENLMKLVYGIFDAKHTKEAEKPPEEPEEPDNELGGLFKKVSHDQQIQRIEKDNLDITESSLFKPWNEFIRDWSDPENMPLVRNSFVTGKWKDSEDAGELLRLDSMQTQSDDDMFGDFEDLETNTKHAAGESSALKRKREDVNDQEDSNNHEDLKNGQETREAITEKKRKLKEKFDAEYDNTDKSNFYDELKASAEKQALLNKSIFDNLPEDLRVQIEGYRPGMYVRMEFERVPSEFISNFDPTYPLVVGALNMGEENIGFVNVKVKKHRWYKKILKTNDPLIISLGWRRFQTIPLYSKLEDDLKFRYLKYTPEFLTCNAHFWGPITPQGTGFLALQRVDSSSEVLKQGFRIAATGAVQELEKSTQIMKKLKLIGHPLKIYKKTAFIKGMFNSALEVAKFEGAKIQTVSGIRGQIKKAASKPEGCFRATFEDKILLSDIVFCRTWVNVDVRQFYNPVSTLLLPLDQKNSWSGCRTAGEIKRETGTKCMPNTDSLYTPIDREPKVFKPLAIPKRLQKALPYRDKPKYQEKNKKPLERVAVVHDAYEKKVSTLMKMLKTNYEHKQEHLKQQTKERIEKHQKYVEEQEGKKAKKLRQQKKEVFRNKSKRQAVRDK